MLSCFDLVSFLHCFAFRAIVAVIRCCFVLVAGEVLRVVAELSCIAVVDVVSSLHKRLLVSCSVRHLMVFAM